MDFESFQGTGAVDYIEHIEFFLELTCFLVYCLDRISLVAAVTSVGSREPFRVFNICVSVLKSLLAVFGHNGRPCYVNWANYKLIELRVENKHFFVKVFTFVVSEILIGVIRIFVPLLWYFIC